MDTTSTNAAVDVGRPNVTPQPRITKIEGNDGNDYLELSSKNSPPVKQLLVDPKPENLQPRLAWVEATENYLVSRGWTMTGTNEKGMSKWNDPMGSSALKAETRPMVDLPLKGGGTETIRQLCIPALPWEYGMEEALSIQWQRDRNSKSLEELIAIKEAELNCLKENLASKNEAKTQA